ncbi:cation-binding protein [Flexivirga sp. ID2601S]|uniref:Cation-binding protein n=1 Tax=Flexivirga aerilata TaxID=1656889 RepID=A0A849AN17_9MICO|nr:hemerythrin domain-containing protein [Flexivirga aerilata]NNG40771.1 cation-binding protein [Flexivirga aerilata]
MDITDIILAQHDEQRRSFAALEEWPRDDVEGLEAVWRRLAILLENHAEAEERYFFPELLKLGTGAADAPDAEEETDDAIGDHNNIRKAIRAADDATVGSDEWWQAVTDCNVYNSRHMGEEERQDLADFRQQASLQLRHDIAVQFLRFEALHASGGITPKDKDPEEYVEKHASDGPVDPSKTSGGTQRDSVQSGDDV